MHINSILESYPVSILNDKKIFTILSYMLNAGAISSLSLKKILDDADPALAYDEMTMIQMYKLNLIERNKYNDWLPTRLSQALLSKVGVSQKVSINILEEFIKKKEKIEWIKYAIEKEEDISVSIQTYLKFLIASYLLKNYIKNRDIDEDIKNNFFHSIYFTCTNDFYILDKNTYLEKKHPSLYISYNNKRNNHFQFYERSNKYLIELNKLNSQKDDIDHDMSILNYSTRSIYSFISNHIDIGFKSMGIEKITALLKDMKIHNKELYLYNISCSETYSSKIFSEYISEITKVFIEDRNQKITKILSKNLLKSKKDEDE
ncbi:MAG TPA: hypothetical protein EYG73_03125 [Arcobacter sp.]|nr:hypothetical protein [Arcobacter sp.]